jgi:hypothetical protein
MDSESDGRRLSSMAAISPLFTGASSLNQYIPWSRKVCLVFASIRLEDLDDGSPSLLPGLMSLEVVALEA